MSFFDHVDLIVLLYILIILFLKLCSNVYWRNNYIGEITLLYRTMQYIIITDWYSTATTCVRNPTTSHGQV